ncbi:MAG: endonuclease [candidate division WOR-3 bacterium]|nr:endonuclease [candidate division WOR-3 bacterium]MCX7947218.1 endonuclease [candidate division WOR-3 bacterium]MDW8150273.1 endonuclease [candidate division WOR-3 bacterium]
MNNVYEALIKYFGKQNWWPGDSKLEISISAILTQNTSWKNVESAIYNLKVNNLLPENDNNYMFYARKILNIQNEELMKIIRPCGFYRIKTIRIKNFLEFLVKNGGFENLDKLDDIRLRQNLLSINGVGKETADAIILYVFQRPSFVIDKYTIRILNRHGIYYKNYEEYKKFFESSIKKDIEIYKEFHALLVNLAKEFCKKHKAYCQVCPINFWSC